MRTALLALAPVSIIALAGCSTIPSANEDARLEQSVSQHPREASLTPDELAFSVENMNPEVDPGADFYGYAAGAWDERVALPEGRAAFNMFTVTDKRLRERLKKAVTAAAANADQAPDGSAHQQVGMMYNSFVDVEKRNALGIAPLVKSLEQIQALSSKEELSRYLGEYAKFTNQWPILTVEVFGALSDSSVNATYLRPGAPGLLLDPIYEQPAGSPPKQMYAQYIAALLQKSGYEEGRSLAAAERAVALETLLHDGKMAPELKVDIRNLNNPKNQDQLNEEFGGFNIAEFMSGFGASLPETVIVTDPEVPAAVGKAFEEYSLQDFKDYLTYRIVQKFSGVLSEDFADPANKLNADLLQLNPPATPVDDLAISFIRQTLAQPLGRVYVENFYGEEDKQATLEIIEFVKAAFRERIVANDWLSDSTRQEALTKLDAFYYEAGYPDEWIDYSQVDIGEDPVANMMAIAEFDVAQMVAKQDKPAANLPFSDALHTGPTVVNAAYNPTRNGFEVTAAIAQPPAFEPDKDAAVRFCRLGAVIGHEMTHGFDTGGREFDATGTLRNWWTPEDTRHFDIQAQKLIDQASAYEVLPDTFINGQITVKENMADVGGIALAHHALMNFLEDNPDQNVMIDGFSPSQRCFLAWTQLWAEKSTETATKNQLSDAHPPNRYRAIAPLLHMDEFYSAFDIGPDDPMWIAPEDRVRAW